MALPNWIKNNTWQWIIGTIIAIAAITVPLTINQKSQKNVVSVGDGTISDSEIHVGDKIYNKGITKEEFESNLHNFEQRIIDEIRKTEPSQTRHRELEIELEIVREKLSNLQQSFEEETKRRKEAVTALEKLEGALPEAKIKEARKNLQSGGDAKIAEELFDEVDEEGAVLVALAAYQSGQLAEGRIDYAKAMKKYRRAVALENSNPDYLLAAGTMARTLGDYKEAQPWLEKLLQLRQKETTETVELALVQNELAGLYEDMGKYEEAEPLYKRSLGIYEKSLGA
ncbi:MAG: tetratricopeptide repeat protein, partial [Planctomycetes bacterium]|nr:tetratricopeptide repeat protein [Planctomycetota bacterium]